MLLFMRVRQRSEITTSGYKSAKTVRVEASDLLTVKF